MQQNYSQSCISFAAKPEILTSTNLFLPIQSRASVSQRAKFTLEQDYNVNIVMHYYMEDLGLGQWSCEKLYVL